MSPLRLVYSSTCRCGADGSEDDDNRCVCPAYAKGPTDAFKGLVTPPRCRQGHLLADCECWRNNRTEERE